MKKWVIVLCCVLVAAIVAFAAVTYINHTKVTDLNKNVEAIQAESDLLKAKNEEAEKTIQELNLQIADLTEERDDLTETLDSLNRNLSSSQQKMQSVMYILTDGEAGSIESILSSYMKIYEDVKPDSAYFDAVRYVTEHQLMDASEEEIFGVDEALMLEECADGLWRLNGKNGTAEETMEALLAMEKENDEKTLSSEELISGETEETETEEAAIEETEVREESGQNETEESEQDKTDEETETSSDEKTETEEPNTETEDETAANAENDLSTAVLTRERLYALCDGFVRETGIEEAEIVFPESETAEATRGDLAVVLWRFSLAQ